MYDHSSIRRRALALAAIAACTLVVRPARAEDIVHLKNGGRVAGIVVEESPTAGVRVKLADGRVRAFRTDEVVRVEYEEQAKPPAPPPETPVPQAPAPPEPAPPPPEPKRGTLVLRSGAPGHVSVDGTDRGEAPVTITLVEGVHRARIDFDEGGQDERTVSVSEGRPTDVTFTMSEARQIFVRGRRGLRIGLSVEPTFAYLYDSGFAYGGGRGTLSFNIGLTPAVDLRLGAFATAMQGEYGQLSPFGASVLARFNLGSTYVVSAGLYGGYALGTELENLSYDHVDANKIYVRHEKVFESGPFVGPRWSLLGIRFGKQKQFEADVYQSVALAPAGSGRASTGWYENGITLTMLLLPSAVGVAPAPSQRTGRN